MLSNWRNMGNLKHRSRSGVTIPVKLISTSTHDANLLLSVCVHFWIIFTIRLGVNAITYSQAQSIPSYNRISSSLFSSQSASNEVPRLPIWNSGSFDDSRHVDLTQLRQLIGEPRVATRDVSQLINRPKPKCNRRIRILNGVTRIRERGSLARFQCSHGFTLIGPTTIVCLRDEWSEPSPICVRNGCRSLDVPRNGVKRESIGGAVSAFFCLGNSVLVGDSILFCDGVKWNGTVPTCHTPITTTLQPITREEELWPVSSTAATRKRTNTESIWNSNVTTDGHSTTPRTEKLPKFTTEADVKQNDVSGQLDHISTASRAVTPTLPSYVTHYNSVTVDDHEGETTRADQPQLNPTTESVPKPEIIEETRLEFVSTTTTEAPFHETGESLVTASVTTYTNGTYRSNGMTPVVVTTASVTEVVKVETTPRSVVWSSSSSPYPIPPIRVVTSSYTTTTVKPKTTTRRFKIRTRRTRRPVTRKPPKRPSRTTTQKPGKFRPVVPPPMSLPLEPTTLTFELTEHPILANTDMFGGNGRIDYPVAIDKEFSREHVAPIQPILQPDMLSNEHSSADGNQLAHVSMIGGITLFVIGLATFGAAVVLYCWRKNKGIARARPYDMDGRTLSAHDANDDFMWLDQRESGL